MARSRVGVTAALFDFFFHVLDLANKLARGSAGVPQDLFEDSA